MVLVKQMFYRIQHSIAIFWGFGFFLLIHICIELNLILCRWVSFEKNIYRLLTFLSLISNVQADQAGLINNFVPYNSRYGVFYEKYMPIKLRFMVLLCVALFALLVLLWNRTLHLPSLPPTSPNCYLPKSGRHVTSLDQGLSSSEARSGRHVTSLDQSLSSSDARSGKSLGTRLATNLFPVVDKFEISCYLVIWLSWCGQQTRNKLFQ
jgi:hypothetical protein